MKPVLSKVEVVSGGFAGVLGLFCNMECVIFQQHENEGPAENEFSKAPCFVLKIIWQP